jgi:Flp pilus assembly protein TadG
MRFPGLLRLPRIRRGRCESPERFTDFHQKEDFKLEKVCRLCRLKRRGAAVVEFAVVAPVFFLMILGMIEVARALMVQQIITNASREGARRAVLTGAQSSEVRQYVADYLNGVSVPATIENVAVVPTDLENDAGNGEPVTVTVQIGFDQVSWLPSPMFFVGGRNTLSATTVMRRESVQ